MLDTSARLLRLVALLTTRPWWSGIELAARLDVTARTVRRDIDRLRRLDYPVESVPGPGGGYRLGAGGRLPPLLLDADEAVALAVCLRAGAAGSVAGVEEAAVGALAKVEQTLPAPLRPRVAAIEAATVALTGDAVGVDPDVLLVVAQACRDGHRLRFDHRRRDADDGSPAGRRRRHVEPYRLVHAARRWYLVAHDLDRAAWRTFRLDRISHPQPASERFVLTDPPDAAALVSRALAIGPYPHRARVLLEAPLAQVRERVPPTVAVLEADGDRTVLSTGARDLRLIAAHLAMLGVEFRVLEPPELVAAVADLAGRLHRAADRS